jgi:hypothetical protein
MKKITLMIVMLSWTLSALHAQFIVAEDKAENYGTTWTNGDNQGIGFSNWDMWKTGSSGWFIGSSSSNGFGNIDTNSKSFGMWGNPVEDNNYSNAQRILSNYWGDGATFSIQLAIAYRNGNKGIDLFGTGFEKIWNFNVGSDKYQIGGIDLGWSYSQTSVFTLSATQNGSNIDITLTRGSDSYSTTINGKTLYAFKLYNGSTNSGDNLNNLFFNNLKISYSDWSKVPPNIKVKAEGIATITTNKNVSELEITSGSSTTIESDKQLTAGTLTNNGTLTLKSGATALTTTISGSGTTNVEQYLSSGRQWWYLSSPVSAAQTTIFNTNSNKIGYYNEVTATYTDPITATESMTVGKGYVVKFADPDARTITFTGGSLNNGDITITLTRTGTENAKRGFNLIGNPYPSYIDWDAIYHDATNPATNMRDAIWFRTYSSGMTFHTYSDGDAVPTTSGVTGKIAPMQAFWVKVHADGSNGSLTFKNAHRSHKAETGYNPLKVKAADDRQRVRLVLSDGTNSDETLIVGKSYASDSQDAYDIEKMSNESTDISEIYSMIGTETMVINSVAPITAGKTVALGIRSTSEKAYSITASQLQNIPTDVRVVLVDAEDESETELSEGVSYNFVAPAGAVNNRFSIQFRSPGATTQVDNDSKNKILVYSNSQQQIEIISTESLPAGTQIRVFNAAGQTIAQMQAAGNRISIPASISKGVYFCHIENTNQNLQYKVIVR